MAESVDALVSNTSRFTPVPVRPRLWVQGEKFERTSLFLCLLGYVPFDTQSRGRCFGGASADFSSLYKCAVLLRNIRILIENHLYK